MLPLELKETLVNNIPNPAAEPAAHSRYLDTKSTFTSNPKVYVVEGWEDPDNFSKLACNYHVQCEPVGPVETYLVDILVQCDHKKRRLTCTDTQVFEIKLNAH